MEEIKSFLSFLKLNAGLIYSIMFCVQDSDLHLAVILVLAVCARPVDLLNKEKRKMISSITDERTNRRRDERRRIQSRRIYARRKQRVRRQMMLLGAIALLVVLSIGSCTRNFLLKRSAQETSAVKNGQKAEGVKAAKGEKGTGTSEGGSDAGEASEASEELLARVKKEAKEAGYPKEIISLLSKNPETVDFVADYSAKKDITPADTVGSIKKGEIPHLLQWDERWGYSAYGTSTIAVSGCGPTCMSMVISGLTGDNSVTPAKVAEYSMENEYVDSSNDTVWLFMQEASQHWGITGYEITAEESDVEEQLLAGHPVICSVGPGDFTKNGHFLVLAGYEDGKVRINDPFSKKNSEKLWEYKKIKKQIRAIWAYSN